ncbi:hypothetical protein D3C76_1686770 [compost metagenome]
MDTWYVNRSWQVVDNGVQHELNPFVTVGRTADDREDFYFANDFAKRRFQFLNADFLTFEVFHR